MLAPSWNLMSSSLIHYSTRTDNDRNRGEEGEDRAGLGRQTVSLSCPISPNWREGRRHLVVGAIYAAGSTWSAEEGPRRTALPLVERSSRRARLAGQSPGVIHVLLRLSSALKHLRPPSSSSSSSLRFQSLITS